MSSDGVNRRRRVLRTNAEPNDENVAEEVIVERREPMSLRKRLLSRTVLSLAILSMVYYSTKTNDIKEVVMASAKESVSGSPKGQKVVCSEDYNEDRHRFQSCVPQMCGRFVSDAVVSVSEAKQLLSLAQRGMSLGGSSGGATILDLHSGALSMDTNFVNIYKLIERPENENIFTLKDFEVYKRVKTKILETISIHFGIQSKHIYLTHPTFFSRLTSLSAQTPHDEYWHKHVDKQTYKSFHFTSLLYLSTFGEDFFGGRFVFVDKTDNRSVIIEPKLGRLSAFTSGAENEHFVERVTSGTRYAITISFTCDPKYAINDPKLIKRDD